MHYSTSALPARDIRHTCMYGSGSWQTGRHSGRAKPRECHHVSGSLPLTSFRFFNHPCRGWYIITVLYFKKMNDSCQERIRKKFPQENCGVCPVMKKIPPRPAYYPVILTGIVLLVVIGGCVTDTPASPSPTTAPVTPTLPPGHPPLPTITETPDTPLLTAVPSPRFTPDPETGCTMEYHVPEPVDTSVPVRDPMPGIHYSLNESDSGRTVVLEPGDIVEINLRWAPGVAWLWDVSVSGCSIELLNDGYYDTGTDFWNTSGHYRARYRVTGHGRSFIDGIFGIAPGGTASAWNPRFNLTVIGN